MDLSHSRHFYYMSGRFFQFSGKVLVFSKSQNMFHELNHLSFIKNIIIILKILLCLLHNNRHVCLLQAVKVAVSVMIEKIKIDTRDQVSKLHTHACTSARSP